jgi:hypothetical protein
MTIRIAGKQTAMSLVNDLRQLQANFYMRYGEKPNIVYLGKKEIRILTTLNHQLQNIVKTEPSKGIEIYDMKVISVELHTYAEVGVKSLA